LVTSRRLVSAGGRGYLRQFLLLVPVTSALLAFFPPVTSTLPRVYVISCCVAAVERLNAIAADGGKQA